MTNPEQLQINYLINLLLHRRGLFMFYKYFVLLSKEFSLYILQCRKLFICYWISRENGHWWQKKKKSCNACAGCLANFAQATHQVIISKCLSSSEWCVIISFNIWYEHTKEIWLVILTCRLVYVTSLKVTLLF